jgi:hypothetical protein
VGGADRETLRQLKISHIINISRDQSSPFAGDGLIYHQCYIADNVSVFAVRMRLSDGRGCLLPCHAAGY